MRIPLVTFNDSHQMPIVGFGTGMVDDDAGYRSAQAAITVGYRSFDSASGLGNEAGVGRTVTEAIAAGRARSDFFVTGKAPVPGADVPIEMVRAVDLSRKRLGLDVVDLYLIHHHESFEFDFDRCVQAYRALLSVQQDGVIRSVGVSNLSAEQLRGLVETTGSTPAVNQIELHPYLQQGELLRVHAELGIVTQAWGALGSGDIHHDPTISTIAQEHGVTSAQVVLRWLVERDTMIHPKSTSPTRMATNLDLFGFELTPQQHGLIEALDGTSYTSPY